MSLQKFQRKVLLIFNLLVSYNPHGNEPLLILSTFSMEVKPVLNISVKSDFITQTGLTFNFSVTNI